MAALEKSRRDLWTFPQARLGGVFHYTISIAEKTTLDIGGRVVCYVALRVLRYGARH